eukprot:CAMPEP_0172313714 /NCGR_PEP_ID=MMETSP1058-20130122/20813_1 /TAXON_ID=83371 /ORGANISM="Detonula confervacea, Strain CCMP 353" /LENGTH=432 /DNA_ID=CAMNT_0013027417 /DNA_START=498 /DNA_END=1796 /DNA_ORIENTATION=-
MNEHHGAASPSQSHLRHHQGGGYHLLQEAQYMLNDRTMRLSPFVDRPWLHFNSNILSESAKKDIHLPKRKLILTDFGWNHPNATKGLSEFPRSLRSRELLQAFIDHPDFDPTVSWTREMAAGNATVDPALQYVVLMDIETCFESNYPNPVEQYQANADTQGGRLVNFKVQNPCSGIGLGGCHDLVGSILVSSLFQKHPNGSSLMYFECSGNGFARGYRKINPSLDLFIFSLSSAPHRQLLTASDMGLPPPPPHPVWLSFQQRQAIRNCESESPQHRPYLFTFMGKLGRSQVRQKLKAIHNGKDVLVTYSGGIANETYSSVLYKSIFSGAPRGDNLFSYRFTEVLSAGAIPVVYADQWVLPFHQKLVDWGKCAVVIPEKNARQTVDILGQIDPAQRCRMRQYCYDIYLKYMVNPEAHIAGMLKSIEVARKDRL